ncbi:MAG: cysteine--tRNA ligase [Rickettsiales bacterium]|nr:cysteine--tRNA ligase [Rickettsiales bacterium]
MSRRKEEFEAVHDGKVGIYSCGPTVYSEPHIGNTRSALFADLLKKMFLLAGYEVKHVMNITDVGHLTGDSDDGEDKMEVEATKEGLTVEQITKKYTDIFFDFSKMLNIMRPSVVSKATEHVPDQIEFLKVLEKKGYTYKTTDGIYFDTSKLDDYGYLARLDVKGNRAGERVEMGEKKNATDFALWKFSKAGEKRLQEWDSPWGVGFPGWHLECSAMSLKYLGNPFDIHTGGTDNISPHHVNEIAQNEAFCDVCSPKGVVHYWMHGGMLIMNSGEKMSKSLGHRQTLRTELTEKGIDPLAFRYLCLTAHYRSQMVFSEEALKDSAIALKRLQNKTLKIKEEAGAVSYGLSDEGQILYDKIASALFDDLNTAVALVALREMLDTEVVTGDKLWIIEKIDSVFGLDLLKEQTLEIPTEVQKLLDERAMARANKDWAKSDELRDRIAEQGFVVKDSKDGQSIERN